MFEQYVRKHFADWKAKGKTQPVPDFGKPDGSLPTSEVLVETGIPATLSLGWLRLWRLKDDTIVYNQEHRTDLVASQTHTRRTAQWVCPGRRSFQELAASPAGNECVD